VINEQYAGALCKFPNILIASEQLLNVRETSLCVHSKTYELLNYHFHKTPACCHQPSLSQYLFIIQNYFYTFMCVCALHFIITFVHPYSPWFRHKYLIATTFNLICRVENKFYCKSQRKMLVCLCSFSLCEISLISYLHFSITYESFLFFENFHWDCYRSMRAKAIGGKVDDSNVAWENLTRHACIIEM
jgi:hypothetical protein